MKTFDKFLLESNQWIRISADRAVKLFPVLSDIKRPGLKRLLAIEKPQDITSVDNFHWWVDDHEECYGIAINGVNVGFWWTDPVLKNMFIKPNMKVIFSSLQEEIDRAEDDHLGTGELIDEIRAELEHIKSLKPETQKHFGSILREL